MTSSQSTTKEMIKFKSTNTSHDILELQFDENKTVLQYKEEIAALLDFDIFEIKFVFKGKVLNDKEKAGALGLKSSTVMMVLNKSKKVQKPTLSSSQQTIPKTGLNTGLGSSSPVGFGGYGIMNHPQYMSAISSAVDQQKVQQMMDDPYYQSMIEQMMEDPQTLKQIMEENPMTKQMMDQNPMMKMIMSNPAMMKMVFNKDTMKMAQEMQKNGGVNPQSLQNLTNNMGGMGGMGALGGLGGMGGFGGMGGLGGFGGMGGLGGFGGLGATNTGNNPTNPTVPNTSPLGQNPFGSGMTGNPFFPMGMMSSGFGANQGMSFPNSQPNPFTNPFFMNNPLNTNQVNQPQPPVTGAQNPTGGNFMSVFQNMQSVLQKSEEQSKYSSQLKQLSSMGFSDKEKCMKFLKQSNGDIDSALQRLCLDDDQKQTEEKKE